MTGKGDTRLPWYVRANIDRRPEAEALRSAYRSMNLAEPSYHDKTGHEAYELAREQTAEALWTWRKAESHA